MELRKLTEEDLKNNIGLLSYAYNTNKDLYPLFFEYEYDGDVKYLYCYDNWFNILCKKSDKQLKHYQFALDDEYELLYSGYEDFYVDHKSNDYDTIIDILKRMYLVINCGKKEESKFLKDGYINFTQVKYDKPESLSMIFPTFYIENKKVYKEFLNKPLYYIYKKRFGSPITYIKQCVEYSDEPIFFNVTSIKEFGLANVLKQGAVSLQKNSTINRYFKVPFNSDILNCIYTFFSSNFYDEEALDDVVRSRGFYYEIPNFVLDYYNGSNKRLHEYKELALAIKEYYKQNNMVLVMNLDRGVNL